MKVSVKLVTKKKAQKGHSLFYCPEWYEVRREIPEAFRRWEQKRGIVAHPLSESQWSIRSGSPRSTRAGAFQRRGFMGHVVTDSSLLGRAGKWRACGWSVSGAVGS